MKLKVNNKRDYIPNRWIHYKFICRRCGASDEGTFDKFTNPKSRVLWCGKCEEETACYNENVLDYLEYQ